MSRSLALLPFEISRQAPDPLPVFADEEELADGEELFEDGGEELAQDEGGEFADGDEPLDDEEQQQADEAALAVEALTQEAEALAATEGDVAASEQEIAAEGLASGEGPVTLDGSGAGSAGADPSDAAAGSSDVTQDSEYFEASETSEQTEIYETTPDATGDAEEEQAEWSAESGAEAGGSGASEAGRRDGPHNPIDQAEWSAGIGAELSGSGASEAGRRDGPHNPIDQAEWSAGIGAELSGSGASEAGRPDGPHNSIDHAWLARADRVALGRWIREELAAILGATGAISPAFLELDEEAESESEELDDLELALAPEPIALALEQAGLELGLACRLRADADLVELSALLADKDGEERIRLTIAQPLGDAHRLPRQLARDLLFALGDDAAATAIPEPTEQDLEESALPVAAEAMLELVRGARSLAEARAAPEGNPLADPMPGLRELLEALALSPTLLQARDRILRGALEALGTGSMPAWLSGLEQLVQLRPGDCQALVALAEYRRLHHDPDGARDLLLRARDLAVEGPEEAGVLDAMATLAEEQGRHDEAVQHLRAAVRVDDDPALYLRLGKLLQERDPQESARSLQRAVVLAPESGALRLELALQLTRIGETARAATEAAYAARLSEHEPEISQAADELLRGLIGDAQLQPG